MFFNENLIPQELKDRDQWVCWKYEKKANGQDTKVPLSPVAGQKASTTDPGTWSTYAAACHATEVCGFDGVGFVFTDADSYIGVDLDDCYIEGTSHDRFSCITEPERGWVQDLGSYTEVSPSGCGIKVIVRGKLPADLERHSWGGNGIYGTGRFFTITGNVLSRNYSRISALAPDTLNALLHTWFPPVARHDVAEAAERMTDAEVLRRVHHAVNRAKAADLYQGRWEEWYPSQSDADAGLVALLAFYTGPCPQQLDRLFRTSGLMRGKWDEGRSTTTYGERTIDHVLALMEDYYDMGARDTNISGIVGPNPGEALLTTRDFRELLPVDPKVAKRKWREGLEGYDSLGASERPLYLQLVHDHVAPLAQRLGSDWVDLMALSFLSSFFSDVTIERLPLNLWVIGISAQGVGKSVTSDELELTVRETASELACNLSTFTGGSNAGLIRLLAQDRRKKVLTYASEWTSLIKLMDSEHSGSLREALLNYYDGRGYTHVLANEILTVDKPYLVVNGLTTKANWAKATDYADTGNGFYSRFLFACPDVLPAGEEYPYRTRAQRSAVVGQLYSHLANLSKVEMAVLDSRQSAAYRAYAHSLGMDNHTGAIDMDEVGLSLDDDDAQPAGRRLAQVKKVAAVLELLEEAPQVRQGVFRVREANVERAVRLVQRSSAYARRAYGWLARSNDEQNAAVVRHALGKQADSEYGLVTRTGLGIAQVKAALELLESETLVASRVDAGRRLYSLKGA